VLQVIVDIVFSAAADAVAVLVAAAAAVLLISLLTTAITTIISTVLTCTHMLMLFCRHCFCSSQDDTAEVSFVALPTSIIALVGVIIIITSTTAAT
jgi:hypothetical protein